MKNCFIQCRADIVAIWVAYDGVAHHGGRGDLIDSQAFKNWYLIGKNYCKAWVNQTTQIAEQAFSKVGRDNIAL